MTGSRDYSQLTLSRNVLAIGGDDLRGVDRTIHTPQVCTATPRHTALFVGALSFDLEFAHLVPAGTLNLARYDARRAREQRAHRVEPLRKML